MDAVGAVRRPLPSFRALVPTKLEVPCGFSDAVVCLPLHIDDDGAVTPALPLCEIQAVMLTGSVELVEQFCQMWTRWLDRVEREAFDREPI